MERGLARIGRIFADRGAINPFKAMTKKEVLALVKETEIPQIWVGKTHRFKNIWIVAKYMERTILQTIKN